MKRECTYVFVHGVVAIKSPKKRNSTGRGSIRFKGNVLTRYNVDKIARAFLNQKTKPADNTKHDSKISILNIESRID